jgi:hypothetical protein
MKALQKELLAMEKAQTGQMFRKCTKIASEPLNRRQPRFSGICWRARMIISAKRQDQHTASIRESGRCRPEFCDEPVDQTSRDPKLVAHRNRKCLSHFRSIGEGTHHRSRASASAQSSSEADCHWEVTSATFAWPQADFFGSDSIAERRRARISASLKSDESNPA